MSNFQGDNEDNPCYISLGGILFVECCSLRYVKSLNEMCVEDSVKNVHHGYRLERPLLESKFWNHGVRLESRSGLDLGVMDKVVVSYLGLL